MRPAVESCGAGWATERREPAPAGRADAPLHDAEELTGGGREALIRFRGKVYTLRITRQDKLLLTK
jgi:hemin uptake protein HemP